MQSELGMSNCVCMCVSLIFSMKVLAGRQPTEAAEGQHTGWTSPVLRKGVVANPQ